MTEEVLAVLETIAIHGPINADHLGAWLEVETEAIYPSLVQLVDAKRIRMVNVCRREWLSEAA